MVKEPIKVGYVVSSIADGWDGSERFFWADAAWLLILKALFRRLEPFSGPTSTALTGLEDKPRQLDITPAPPKVRSIVRRSRDVVFVNGVVGSVFIFI